MNEDGYEGETYSSSSLHPIEKIRYYSYPLNIRISLREQIFLSSLLPSHSKKIYFFQNIFKSNQIDSIRISQLFKSHTINASYKKKLNKINYLNQHQYSTPICLKIHQIDNYKGSNYHQHVLKFIKQIDISVVTTTLCKSSNSTYGNSKK